MRNYSRVQEADGDEAADEEEMSQSARDPMKKESEEEDREE